jgi:hypothetical protein
VAVISSAPTSSDKTMFSPKAAVAVQRDASSPQTRLHGDAEQQPIPGSSENRSTIEHCM